MPIPKSRKDLVDYLQSTYEKLHAELEATGSRAGSLHCVDDWSIKDLLAVRVWWTEHVIDWVEAGQRGERPVTPADGYRWKETPRLNADIVKKCRRESYKSLRQRLEQGYRRALQVIDGLDEGELLDVGVFEWAGGYPVSRWISINTARQYTTARTFIRRAQRKRANRK
ncbi:MAG: ClbS/DfsB family four-helix bundle protein [Gammaproteobacteria bacterium]|nr:ClbS/DfsB family four-helix bundle protein [Gammaproteobacteria bacterium]NNF59942.1 ClbS/DfsB family four-helix bundle protein [Gammaproteobacteria bacterium]NNM19694.1 ClbS/DfsB family four-helix bundle protein [Gammaproteobacteria bacterium]